MLFSKTRFVSVSAFVSTTNIEKPFLNTYTGLINLYSDGYTTAAMLCLQPSRYAAYQSRNCSNSFTGQACYNNSGFSADAAATPGSRPASHLCRSASWCTFLGSVTRAPSAK